MSFFNPRSQSLRLGEESWGYFTEKMDDVNWVLWISYNDLLSAPQTLYWLKIQTTITSLVLFLHEWYLTCQSAMNYIAFQANP